MTTGQRQRCRPGRLPFRRPVRLEGWSTGSAWGYDPVLECYWAELVRVPDAAAVPDVVRIGPEHLLTTVTGLARAVAFATGAGDGDAYLALTA